MKINYSAGWFRRLRWGWVPLVSVLVMAGFRWPETGEATGKPDADRLPRHALLSLPLSLVPAAPETVVAPWNALGAELLETGKEQAGPKPPAGRPGPVAADRPTPASPQRKWQVRGRVETGDGIRFCIEETTTMKRWWLRPGEELPPAGLLLENTEEGWRLRDLRGRAVYGIEDDLTLRRLPWAVEETDQNDEKTL